MSMSALVALGFCFDVCCVNVCGSSSSRHCTSKGVGIGGSHACLCVSWALTIGHAVLLRHSVLVVVVVVVAVVIVVVVVAAVFQYSWLY
jgi:hypothetical protein